MAEGDPIMVALAEMRDQLICSLCDGEFKNPHSFRACGHCFCYDCASDVLEGPGIVKSMCPECQLPQWKNDLVVNQTVAGAVEKLKKYVDALGVKLPAYTKPQPEAPMPSKRRRPASQANGGSQAKGSSQKRKGAGAAGAEGPRKRSSRSKPEAETSTSGAGQAKPSQKARPSSSGCKGKQGGGEASAEGTPALSEADATPGPQPPEVTSPVSMQGVEAAGSGGAAAGGGGSVSGAIEDGGEGLTENEEAELARLCEEEASIRAVLREINGQLQAITGGRASEELSQQGSEGFGAVAVPGGTDGAESKGAKAGKETPHRRAGKENAADGSDDAAPPRSDGHGVAAPRPLAPAGSGPGLSEQRQTQAGVGASGISGAPAGPQDTGAGSASLPPASASLASAQIRSPAASAAPAPAPAARGGAAGGTGATGPVPSQMRVAGTSMDKEQLSQLSRLCKRTGATLAKRGVEPTHMVTGGCSADRRVGRRTLKYFSCIMKGCWVLSSSWVVASTEAGRWLPEEDHEVLGDTWYAGGPRRAREAIAAGLPPLFAGHRFLLSGAFSPPSPPKETLEELLGLGGGELLRRMPDPGDGGDPPVIICSPTMTRPEVGMLRDVWGVMPIRPNWLLDSMGGYQLQGYERYEWDVGEGEGGLPPGEESQVAATAVVPIVPTPVPSAPTQPQRRGGRRRQK